MYPILGRFGPFFLYAYTVVMGLGLAAGIGLTYWLEKRDGRERPNWQPDWIEGLIIGLFAGLVGGRIGFVWANISYYQEHLDEIGLVWRGGLSYHGALLAGLLAFWAWSAWRRRSFGDYSGLLAPAFILGSAIGWLACWLEGCAYGRETSPGPFAADLPDSFGVYGLRYQTQMMGLVLCLLTLLLILLLRRRMRPVALFWTALLVLAAGRLVVSLMRGDQIPLLGFYRLDTILDTVTLLMALIALLVLFLWRPSPASSRHSATTGDQHL